MDEQSLLLIFLLFDHLFWLDINLVCFTSMTLLVKKHNLEDDPKAIPNYQSDEIWWNCCCCYRCCFRYCCCCCCCCCCCVCVSLLNSQLLKLVILIIYKFTDEWMKGWYYDADRPAVKVTLAIDDFNNVDAAAMKTMSWCRCC